MLRYRPIRIIVLWMLSVCCGALASAQSGAYTQKAVYSGLTADLHYSINPGEGDSTTHFTFIDLKVVAGETGGPGEVVPFSYVEGNFYAEWIQDGLFVEIQGMPYSEGTQTTAVYDQRLSGPAEIESTFSMYSMVTIYNWDIGYYEYYFADLPLHVKLRLTPTGEVSMTRYTSNNVYSYSWGGKMLTRHRRTGFTADATAIGSITLSSNVGTGFVREVVRDKETFAEMSCARDASIQMGTPITPRSR